MHKLTLELPDNIYKPLVKKAKHAGRTPEEIAVDYVATGVSPSETDKLLSLLGSIEADVSDVAHRHDEYIGQGLIEKARKSG